VVTKGFESPRLELFQPIRDIESGLLETPHPSPGGRDLTSLRALLVLNYSCIKLIAAGRIKDA
jgi:hypothetical protein